MTTKTTINKRSFLASTIAGIIFGIFGFGGISLIGLLIGTAFNNTIASYCVMGIFEVAALFCGVGIFKEIRHRGLVEFISGTSATRDLDLLVLGENSDAKDYAINAESKKLLSQLEGKIFYQLRVNTDIIAQNIDVASILVDLENESISILSKSNKEIKILKLNRIRISNKLIAFINCEEIELNFGESDTRKYFGDDKKKYTVMLLEGYNQTVEINKNSRFDDILDIDD